MSTPCKYIFYTSIRNILIVADTLKTTQQILYCNEHSRILAPLKTAGETQEGGKNFIAETDSFNCVHDNIAFFKRDATF